MRGFLRGQGAGLALAAMTAERKYENRARGVGGVFLRRDGWWCGVQGKN